MRTMGTLNAPPRSPRILPMNVLSLVSSTIVASSALYLNWFAFDQRVVARWPGAIHVSTFVGSYAFSLSQQSARFQCVLKNNTAT